MTILLAVAQSKLEILFVLVALLCLGGAAYCAYLRNVLGCGLLLVVAVVALLFGVG